MLQPLKLKKLKLYEDIQHLLELIPKKMSFSSYCSVPKLCPTFCSSTDYSTPTFSVLQHCQKLLRFMSIESVMLANHLTLYHPLSTIRELNAKGGSQEIPGKTGKFALEVQHESGQRLTKFSQENMWVIVNTLFQQPKKWLYTWTPPDVQYRNLVMFLEAKVEKLYTVSEKQDMELAMAQIMSSLLQNPGLYWIKWGKPLGHSGMS